MEWGVGCRRKVLYSLRFFFRSLAFKFVFFGIFFIDLRDIRCFSRSFKLGVVGFVFVVVDSLLCDLGKVFGFFVLGVVGVSFEIYRYGYAFFFVFLGTLGCCVEFFEIFLV